MPVKPEDLSRRWYTSQRDEKGKDLREDDRETVHCVRGFGQIKKATSRVSSRKETCARSNMPEERTRRQSEKNPSPESSEKNLRGERKC